MAKQRVNQPLMDFPPSEETGREDEASRNEDTSSKCLTMKDRRNLALLFLLYTLQGVPLGLSASVPMLLQVLKVGYKQQAVFSLVSWPFSVKLLWAPIVDSIYSNRFGRRKSWLIPAQYTIGSVMIVLSYYINGIIGSEGAVPNVALLTVIFFLLYTCAATQDIAVDGWAVSLLPRQHVGHASTCNSVGQTTGYFLGYTVFLALESKDFCNTYLRSEPQDTGIVDLPTFFFFWGVTFIVITSLVGLFKKERTEKYSEIKKDVLMAYMQLKNILRLGPVQQYALFILTAKIGFAAMDNVTYLKIIEAGVPKEQIALLALPLVPVQILLPLVISRYVAGPRPLDLYTKAVPYRLLLGLFQLVILWWTWSLSDQYNGEFPYYYYVVLVLVFLLYQVFVNIMFVASMGFHAQVSDPAMGGTYMTLLNTLANLGGAWTATVALWLVDVVSVKDCEGVSDLSLDCDTMQELQACEAAGGHCVTYIDGYTIEMCVCVAIGFVWYFFQRNRIKNLQNIDKSAWMVSHQEHQNL